MTDSPQVPAGWYPDPNGSGSRYWDGTTWTDHTSPTGPAPAHGDVTVPQNANAFWITGLVLGFLSLLICPILFGPAGIVLGGIAVARKDQRGWIAVGVSAVCMIAGMAIGAAAYLSMN
jgi:hypothetical protein